MSKTVNVHLNVNAAVNAGDVDGTTFPFSFETATAMDLVCHIMTNMELPADAEYKVKYKTMDLEGNPKVATLTTASALVDGTEYHVYISPRKDESPGSSQRLPQTPTSTRQYDFLSMATPLSRFSIRSPGRQLPGHRPLTSMEQPQAAATDADTKEDADATTSTPAEQLSKKVAVVPPMDQVSAASKELSKPMSLTPHTNKGLFLVDLYTGNKSFMDKEFEKMKPTEPMIFYDVNVGEQLNTPRTIAALVLVANPHLTDYDHRVADAARDYAQKAVVDIVMAAKESVTLPRNGVDPLLAFFKKMTNNDLFDALGRSGGPVMEAVRKRKMRAARRNGMPPRKKSKATFVEYEMEQLNVAARNTAAATTMEEIEEAVKQSSSVRCQWIEAMAQGKTMLIPELVMAKFPQFKQNASLLKYDFAYTLEHVFNIPSFNVAHALETFSPAILALSVSKEINTEEEAAQAQGNMLVVGKTLIQLVASYCRQKKKCVADRLIAESQETPSVNAMLAHRRDIKQNAPMIFVFNSYPGTHYYVACDDFALKVPGKFSDALQCLASLHYIFNLEYAKEMLQFNLLLENLCEINVSKMDKTRVNLYHDLKAKQRVLSSNESTSTLENDME